MLFLFLLLLSLVFSGPPQVPGHNDDRQDLRDKTHICQSGANGHDNDLYVPTAMAQQMMRMNRGCVGLCPCVGRCRSGLHDCDGDGTCETAITSDRNNCGRCGKVCKDGEACADGICMAIHS